MTPRAIDILQVATSDELGGAERVALNLHRAYRAAGLHAVLAVGRRRTREPGVVEIRHDVPGLPARRRLAWRTHHAMQPHYSRTRIAKLLARLSHRMAAPAGKRDELRGLENFDYPGTWDLLDSLVERPGPPRVIQLHNLHGGYFDLRALPMLTAAAPVVLTLHDAWLWTGHCAHAIGCERWQTGCGSCPDLSIYPAVLADATAENWRRKRDIFGRCHLRVTAPSQWLMRQVERSILWPAVREARVIHNGVDAAVFRPVSRAAARRSLGLPPQGHVVLFAGLGSAGGRPGGFKDIETLDRAAEIVAGGRHATGAHASAGDGRPLALLAWGTGPRGLRLGGAPVRFIPFERHASRVADWYRAADVYVHAARADTFPNAVLEAMACGTPVVATAVGGIVEQVASLSSIDGHGEADTPASHGEPGASSATGPPTGILTPPGDAPALASAIKRLLADDDLRHRLAAHGVQRVSSCFTLARQAASYMAWFDGIVATDRARLVAKVSARRCAPC